MEEKREKNSGEVKKAITIVILLLLLLPVICYSFYYIGYNKGTKPENPTEKKELNIAQNLSDAGDLPVNGEDSLVSEEQIDIPGYAKLTVDEEVSYISLMNLDTNTVYFVYSIYEGDNLLFKTDAIPPNKQLDVNFYELLEGKKGPHNLLFVIDTFDIETHRQCNGASQDVVITVK